MKAWYVAAMPVLAFFPDYAHCAAVRPGIPGDMPNSRSTERIPG